MGVRDKRLEIVFGHDENATGVKPGLGQADATVLEVSRGKSENRQVSLAKALCLSRASVAMDNSDIEPGSDVNIIQKTPQKRRTA
jgi:hypothetical protein